MELNPAQKQAVEYISGPLLVLAGPGTGKTQLLSQKVAYILENTDASPDNILCVTFTDSGASNMRERLKTLIGRDALKVHISTYHVLGQEILAQYRTYSDTYDRQLDEAIDEVTQFKIVKSLQSALPATDILRGDNVKDIISVISSAKAAGLTAEDLTTIAQQNAEDSQVISSAISPYLWQVVPRKYQESLNKAYQPIWEILQNYTAPQPLLPGVERQIGEIARALEAALAEAEAANKVTPLSDWKKAYFEQDDKGNYRLKDRVANKKLSSVAKIMSAYEDHLRAHNLYDFDDMIQEAVKALTTDEGFRLTLSERYQYIMLDEFQDTNPSQLMIVKLLTQYDQPSIMAVGDDDQAIYEFQGAMSSNFRDFEQHYGAKVITLTENYRSTQEILDFSKCVVEQVPDRFDPNKDLHAHRPAPASSQITRREFFSANEEYGWIASEIARLVRSGVEQRSIAVISYKTKYFLPLLPYLKEYPEIKIAYDKQDNLLEEPRLHEVLTICRYIYELSSERKVDTSLIEILSYPCFGLSPLEVVKLAGQARATHHSLFEAASEYDDANRGQGSASRSSADRGHQSASESSANRGDDSAHEDSANRGGESTISGVAAWLAGLAAKSFTEPVMSLLDYIIGLKELDGYRSPWLEYHTMSGGYDTYSLYESLAALKGRLTKHFGDKPLRLKDLIELLDDYTAAEMPLATTSPYREASDAVQILSAHKSKGLEFDHVFIISADHTAWGKGKGNNNLLSLPKNLTQIRHTGVTDGEKLRVLYVALTRAKSHLYITNSLHDFNGKDPARLEYLDEHLEKDDRGHEIVISPFLPNKIVTLDYNENGPLLAAGGANLLGVGTSDAPEANTSDMPEASASASSAASDLATSAASVTRERRLLNLIHWLEPYASQNPDLRALYKQRMENYRLSSTGLTDFVDIVYGGPKQFFRTTILQAPEEGDFTPLIYGNLIHATLEAVTKQNLTPDGAQDFFLAELKKQDLTPDAASDLRDKGLAALAATLRDFGNILHQGQAEVNFSSEHLAIDGVPITGKIDHLVIDDANKTLELYDFKTGKAKYRDKKWSKHPTLYTYALQLEFYKMLLAASREYSQYTVTGAHILFVEPDADGEVLDKPYNFDLGIDLRALAVAIYDLVTSLRFMDDPALFIDPDKSRTVEDVKIFIDAVLEAD